MSRCGLCNRPLRDATSVELGFGPGCWDRLSATARAAALAERDLATPAVPLTGRSDATDAEDAPALVGGPAADVSPAATGGPDGVDRPEPRPRGHRLEGPSSTAPPGATSRRRGPVTAVVLAWAVVLLALYVLIEYWRWVLGGVLLVALVAAIGLGIEARQRRRPPGPS